MSLTHVLTQAGNVPRSVATSARVRLRPVDGVPTIDLVELDTTVDVDGVDEAALQKHAEAAEASCAMESLDKRMTVPVCDELQADCP